MRCPHCKTTTPGTPQCRVCGGDVTIATTDDVLPGLDPTRAGEVTVAVERLSDLETTEEVLGDTRIPTAPADAPVRCRRCGTDGQGRFCENCGMALAPSGRKSSAAKAYLCLACGTPTPEDRPTCISCGQKLTS